MKCDADDDVKEIGPAPSDLPAAMMSEVRGGGAARKQLVGSHREQKKQNKVMI